MAPSQVKLSGVHSTHRAPDPPHRPPSRLGYELSFSSPRKLDDCPFLSCLKPDDRDAAEELDLYNALARSRTVNYGFMCVSFLYELAAIKLGKGLPSHSHRRTRGSGGFRPRAR